MKRGPSHILSLTLPLLLSAFAYGQTSFRYNIHPELINDSLVSLQISVDLHTTPGATLTLDLPARLRRGVVGSALVVKGGEILEDIQSPGRVRIRAASPKMIIRYALRCDASNKLTANGQDPVLRSTWFALRGEDLFILPSSSDQTASLVHVTNFPVDWKVILSASGPTTIAGLRDSLAIGGRNYEVSEHFVDGAPLYLAYPTSLTDHAGALVGVIAKISSAERRFWRAPARPFYVGIVQLNDDSDFSGQGLDKGFMLFLGKDTPQANVLRLIAHENLHSWISRRIGGFPIRDDDLEAWLNEGFVEAYTARILLDARLWSPEQFVADWNASLVRYGTSPVKTAPNARILTDRQRDFDVNKLPYDRGRLLAVLWDGRFREATHGRVSLDDVLRAQVMQAQNDSRHRESISADHLFPVVAKRMSGIDLSRDIERYVDLGEEVDLPKGAFGPCVSMVEVIQPVFDRGFNFGETLRAHGILTGLEPGGPAERAGLHEGDKLRIDEIPGHDSRVTLRYIVEEGHGMTRTVSYKPEGTSNVTFQQLELSSSARETGECRELMLRP